MLRTFYLSIAASLLLSGCDAGFRGPRGDSAGEMCITGTSRRFAAIRQPDHLVLPHDEPALPPHDGREDFARGCLACHSPRYITSQPCFPRRVWLAEVNKMREVYGAPVPQAEVAGITGYLVFLNGKEN